MLYITKRKGYNEHPMNKRTLFTLALAFLALHAGARGETGPLGMLQSLQTETPVEVSLKDRASGFSALGGLPADTDSFLSISRLNELVKLLELNPQTLPGVELADSLDSFAIGISAGTVRDLERLQPLFQVLSAAQNEVAESWALQANDEAARAIVAVQREQLAADGDKLVQATRDFHLSPIYLTLSARAGGEALLQQLAILPLMVPMGADAPVEMTVRSGWRGFCVRGSMLDLSGYELAPEHEASIQENLQNARLYVLARTVGRKLVLVICSNPDEVKLPARIADSVLASPQMAAFDSALRLKAWAVGYSSPAVVKLREDSDLFDYQYVATFMERVFRRLAQGHEACAAAAGSVKSLMRMLQQFLPAQQEAERMMLWQEQGAFYLHLVCGAGAQRFVPGGLHYTELAGQPDTVAYAESTPLAGCPEIDIKSTFDAVENVQRGYMATLQPEAAKRVGEDTRQLQEHRAALEQACGALQNWLVARSGSGTILLRAAAPEAALPVGFALRGEFADEAKAQQTREMLQGAVASAMGGAAELPRVESAGGTVLLTYGNPSLAAEAPSASCPVQGGAVFSINLPAAAGVLERCGGEHRETAEGIRAAAEWIERVEGATCTRDNELHSLLRFRQPAE